MNFFSRRVSAKSGKGDLAAASTSKYEYHNRPFPSDSNPSDERVPSDYPPRDPVTLPGRSSETRRREDEEKEKEKVRRIIGIIGAVEENRTFVRLDRPKKEMSSLYRPLDFDIFEIRLLRLHAGLGEDVMVSLKYASLINSPEYIALSYCWGDASEKKKINIKDWGDVEVTTNLEEALRSVRNGSPKSIMLWVDALCINQQDTQERSQQVRQMRQIYSRAKEVISWVPCRSAEGVEYFVQNHP